MPVRAPMWQTTTCAYQNVGRARIQTLKPRDLELLMIFCGLEAKLQGCDLMRLSGMGLD